MTIAKGTPTGLQTKLYYNSGTYASPTWVEITRTKGEKMPRSKAEITWEDRDSSYKKTKGGHADLSLSFSYRHVRGASDTVRTALLASLVNGTAVELLSCDGTYSETGVVGFRAYYEIMKMDKTAETSEAVMYECEAKHTEYYDNTGTLIEPVDFAGGASGTTTTAAPTTTTTSA
jgi:hypothetical protein